MGTTLTALQAGSCVWRYVAALEGYEHLLTNATTSQAEAAWAATEWTSALGGLYVELDNDQRLHPWEPFPSGGTCKLYVAPDAADTFGIDSHRKSAGAETLLDASCDRDDTTLTVKTTTGFDSAGTGYIGTEAFTYAGTTATTFTGVTRGVFAPFANGNTGAGFSQHHRVGPDPNAVNIQPVVSAQPRVWIGKRIGVWIHREVDGVLDVRAEAQLVFAGRVVDLIDDPQTGCVVVVCKHLLDELREYPLGRDMWSAEVKEGIHLSPGTHFSLSDCPNVGSTPFESTTLLRVVASGAVAPYQINAGLYSISDLFSLLNDWLAGELAAGHINGTYTLSLQNNPQSETRTFIKWAIGAVATHVQFHFFMPNPVAHFLGFDGFPSASTGYRKIWDEGDSNTGYDLMGTEIPKRNVLQPGQGTGPDGLHILYVTEERGTFVDQLDSLPASCPPPAATPLNPGPYEWGIFLLDNSHCVFGAKVGARIQSVLFTGYNYTGASPTYMFWESFKDRSIDDPPISVKQIFIFERNFGELLKQLFFSTGTAGYNHATHDVLPYSLAVGVPGELLDVLEASIDALPGASNAMVVILDEPTTLADLFGGDLILRWTFLRWANGGLQFATWRTPTIAASSATLSESNKAAPAGNVDNHGATTSLSDAWQRSIVKVDYDRDLTSTEKNAGYRSSITFVDRVACDDAGGDVRAFTIKCRHTFAQRANTGAGIEALKDTFLALFPLFSRPVRRMTRSIDGRYFEGLSAGDVVTVTDSWARDPDTGRRGVVARPGFVVSHRCSPGGAMPGGETNDMGGEVELLLLDVNRLAAYGPCAQVDAGAGGGGYDAGTKTLTCLAHAHSESFEAVDASHFAIGDAIRVIEIDPATPSAPLSWDVLVDGQTGNTIIVDSSLGGFDPALHYRVIFRPFADCTTTQQAKCYQADAGDGLVQDRRAPYQYAWGQIDLLGAYTPNAAADQVELLPDTSYEEGGSRDVGHEAACNRLAINLLDYKTAKSSPQLNNAVMSGGGGGTWKLVEIRPLWLSAEILSPSVSRELTVAPWMRSSDGTSASVRVTISKIMPAATSVEDVDRGTFYADWTFTTTSTTWGTATAAGLTLEGVKGSGFVFLLLECSLKAETRGLARCQEGPLIVA